MKWGWGKRTVLVGTGLAVVAVVAGVTASATAAAEPPTVPYEAAPHRYWDHPLDDAFSRWWRDRAEVMRDAPPAATEQDAVRRVLAELGVPESSQMLVFSATSLQRTIGPHRPRALYFNDEIYVGWVPGGRLEIAADDPVVGPVFFIVSFGQSGRLGDPERQTRCLNCHGNADTGNRPALLAASVLSDEAGGSLRTLRDPATGHQVPLAQRFGGWHITDATAAVVPHANLIGESSAGEIRQRPNPVGERFALDRYPRPTSTLLPQLIHEHQVGGVNVLTHALYRARELTPPADHPLGPSEAAALDAAARAIVRYFLFADEAALPANGVPTDPDFARDFAATRRPDPHGRSLKDLELTSRLFTHRCSYLIHTPLWQHLPPLVKDRAWTQLAAALAIENPSPDGRHLPQAERQAIREIIDTTCPDRPDWWAVEK